MTETRTSGWFSCDGDCDQKLLLKGESYLKAVRDGRIVCTDCDPTNGVDYVFKEDPNIWPRGVDLTRNED